MNRKAPISKLESDAVDALLRHRGIIFSSASFAWA